jgi:4-hydroxy-3-polyprenylbenzoate decarboxylase
MTGPERLIVGISGASGVVYGIRLLETLKSLPVESHLVMSPAAEVTLAYETDLKVAQVRALADVCYPHGDIGAAISSGSFRTLGMVVAPCSIRSMAEIACGTTTSLLTRAADVVLKERRRLVLAAQRPSRQPAAAVRDGCGDRAARARLLRRPRDDRRPGRPVGRPGA